MRKAILAALAAAGLAVTGACSGEADVEADLSAESDDSSEGSVEEYCDLAADFDQRDSVPSDAELDGAVEVAPDEIRADVEILVEALKAGEQGSDEAVEATQNIEDWEAENCENNVAPGGSDGGGAEVEGGVDLDAEVDGGSESDADTESSEMESEENTTTTG